MFQMTLATIAGAVLAAVLASAPALAQGADCSVIQKTLSERKDIVAKINASSQSKKVKMTPSQACTVFGKLQANGNEGLKWITANKDWCSIPDSFVEGFKADHTKVTGIHSKICAAAKQQAVMEKRAREQAAQNAAGGGGGGLLGGPGLTGSYRLPQGAL
ncbi:hypothetical protein [Methylobacterium oryzihabitans]|uniref:Uncharacterized protein n=1 Tax=Methylobacterium oryzihabitans TaxID=2499852 RepID=A0A3S2XPK6_9HYPH|nr:hypothetical protein [Methylobacterium oryzihabitans]RVU19852.1 hypothetical protein EOE48_07255 [Methylobacterium oryzihabitans]